MLQVTSVLWGGSGGTPGVVTFVQIFSDDNCTVAVQWQWIDSYGDVLCEWIMCVQTGRVND